MNPRKPSGACRVATLGGRVGVLAAALALIIAILAPNALASSPYPLSSIIGGTTWNEATKVRYASDSDIWDSTWASDNNIYGVWGDGEGFAAPQKKFIGVSKLVGVPSSLTGTDVYYGTPYSNPPPCAQQSTLGGKPRGTVALPGSVMYMFHSTEDLCTSTTWLARSTTNGTSWTDHVNSLVWPDPNGYSPSYFLQTGEAQAGALVPDSGTTPYLFIYALKSGDTSGNEYLARVPASPTNSIETYSKWTWYSGTDASGNPTWASSSATAAAVFHDPDHAEALAVTFDKAIGRYIAQNDHGSDCSGAPCERQVALYDAPSPWGPWTTFDYEDNFDNTGCGSNCLGNTPAVGWTMMQKWFGSDGLTMWPAYSATGVYDSLNFMQGTMSLASGSTVKSLATSTGTPAVLDKLSTSNPGNLQYIDRTYRFTTIPAAYVGKEMIRLANNDKSNAASNYLAFTITTAENVCLGWDSAHTPPSWLSTWTNTATSLVGTPTFTIYKKAFSAGTVTLQGPASGGADSHDMYIVFVGC